MVHVALERVSELYDFRYIHVHEAVSDSEVHVKVVVEVVVMLI